MNDITVVVRELAVRVVTGAPSEDPYGQGFSAIHADAMVDDPESVERLIDAKANRLPVTLRCAMLDVTGPISKAEAEGKSHRFVVAVEGVTYQKPKQPWEDPVTLRRPPA